MRGAAGVAASIAALLCAGCASTVERTTITIDGEPAITVEVAASPDQRRTGLSGRTAVPQGTGMLFLFQESEAAQLWMVNTLVPLDALWIRDGRLVELDHMTPCREASDDRCQIWAPTGEVDAVLETPPGHGHVVGETVSW